MHNVNYTATSLYLIGLLVGTGHGAMSVGCRKDWDEYLKKHVCKVPLGIRVLAPPTSVVIEEIVESSLDSKASAPKKEQAMSTIKGFAPLILSLPKITKLSPGFVKKKPMLSPLFKVFSPLVLLRSI